MEQDLSLDSELKDHRWVIEINISVLNNEGNLFDSLLLSSQIILYNITLPSIEFKENSDSIVVQKKEFSLDYKKRKNLNLPLKYFYFPATYSEVLQN